MSRSPPKSGDHRRLQVVSKGNSLSNFGRNISVRPKFLAGVMLQFDHAEAVEGTAGTEVAAGSSSPVSPRVPLASSGLPRAAG